MAASRLSDDTCNRLAHLALQSIASQLPWDRQEPLNSTTCLPWPSQGLSGSAILRLNCNNRSYAIRSWPEVQDTQAKVSIWHSIYSAFEASSRYHLQSIGAVRDIPVPKLWPWKAAPSHAPYLIPLEGNLWTLSDWLPGQALQGESVDLDLLWHLMDVLALLHSAMHSQRRVDRSETLASRLDALALLDQAPVGLDGGALTPLNDRSLQEQFRQSIRKAQLQRREWDSFLRICSQRPRVCHAIVRDLWRENVLVDSQNRFVGIVDLGAARIDWPGLDFVRLVGSLLGYLVSRSKSNTGHPLSTTAIWRTALERYNALNPYSDIDSVTECERLHEISSILAMAQWIVWLDQKQFTAKQIQSPSVRQRLNELAHHSSSIYFAE